VVQVALAVLGLAAIGAASAAWVARRVEREPEAAGLREG